MPGFYAETKRPSTRESLSSFERQARILNLVCIKWTQRRWSGYVDERADLRISCSHATKSGFLARRDPIKESAFAS